MPEDFPRLNEKENIDAIIASISSCSKIQRDNIIMTTRTGEILTGSNKSFGKVLPIKMRKLAVYKNLIEKEEKKKNTLPLVLRKRILYGDRLD